MESDLVHHQQRGAAVNDLTAGLAYSIAQNYMNRVVCGRPLGKRIFFQGGVAWNAAVVAAFEQLTGKEIVVPPHHDVTGAIGAAILAREEMLRQRGNAVGTKFRGFDLRERHYESSNFECRACPNLCEVSKIVLEGEPPIYYGARCDKFEEAGRSAKSNGDVPDLFAERSRLLLGEHANPTTPRNGKPRIAMPRTLVVYDMFPFWREFLNELGAELVLSDVTNPHTVKVAQEHAAIETCFPVKLALGHALALRETKSDFLFLPSVVNREGPAEGQAQNHYCPYVPAATHVVAARLADQAPEMKSITLPVHLLWKHAAREDLIAIAGAMGLPTRRVDAAARRAAKAQKEFYDGVRRRGREVLSGLNGTPAVVVVGRPYNTNDMGACMGLPEKLRKFGVQAIPIDFLPLESVKLPERYGNMFWRSGQDILRAAMLIAADDRLHAVYLTNFACGPDSFVLSFFRTVMGKKPFLELEVDEHSADAGVLTRVEAFLDSVNLRRPSGGAKVDTAAGGVS
jgi:predicted nucleotide-binding protein (sugar kinase/HSP70/actin superfamily)